MMVTTLQFYLQFVYLFNKQHNTTTAVVVSVGSLCCGWVECKNSDDDDDDDDDEMFLHFIVKKNTHNNQPNCGAHQHDNIKWCYH